MENESIVTPPHSPEVHAGHPSSFNQLASAPEVDVGQVGYVMSDRVLDDWVYLLMSIEESLSFDEWSAVVIARTVQHVCFIDPEESESLGQHIRHILLVASIDIDVNDHEQITGYLADGPGDYYWYNCDDADESMLPAKAWALIKTLDEMPGYKRLALVRKMQQVFDVAVEEKLSLVGALRHVGLIAR